MTASFLAACGGSTKTVTVIKTVTGANSRATTQAAATAPSRPVESPVAFAKRLEQERFSSQWGLVWMSLYSDDQAVISRTDYVACKQRQYADEPSNLSAVSSKQVYDEPLKVHGTTIHTKAVTLHDEWTYAGGRQEESFTEHVANIDDHWKWILADKEYRSYKSGRCLDGSLLPSGRSPIQSKPALARKPKQAGEILLVGSIQGKIFGPSNFKPGGYLFRFEQYDPKQPNLNFSSEASSFVVSLESKPGEVDSPYQLLVNATQKTGTNQVYVSGKLYIDVSSASASYVLRFTPK